MESEIFIIGGGLAGWRAAEAAVRGGASVTLAANGPGNTPDIHALNCPVLPEDSVECFIEDTLSSGKYQNDRAEFNARYEMFHDWWRREHMPICRNRQLWI